MAKKIKISEQQLQKIFALEEANLKAGTITKQDTIKADREGRRRADLEGSTGFESTHKVHKGKKDKESREYGRKAKHKGTSYNESQHPIDKGFSNAMKKGDAFKDFQRNYSKLNEDELWEEFVNELYGVKESTDSKYADFIKVLETSDIIKNKRINKKKFKSDPKTVKEIFSRALTELYENGDEYAAMSKLKEEMEYGDVWDWLKKQISTKVSVNADSNKIAKMKQEFPEKQEKLGAARNKFYKDKNNIKEYDGGYPDGAANDPRAPYNQNDNSTSGKMVKGEFDVLWYDKWVALIKGKGELWALNLDALERSDFEDYANRPYDSEPDGYGGAEYNYSDEWEIDGSVIESFINDNFENIKKGSGEVDWENGAEMLIVDNELRDNLLASAKYIKNDQARNKFISILQQMSETTVAGASATGGSSGPFVQPMVTAANDKYVKRSPAVEMGVDETTTTTTAGNYAYDTPGFNTVDKKFWFPDGKENKSIKKEGKEKTNTQYKGGGFVKIDNCTKLNNNKKAENGGCSQGAIDGVVTVTKGKSPAVISK